jgi:hypothetical protein
MVENFEKKETNNLTNAYWGYMYNNDIWTKINFLCHSGSFGDVWMIAIIKLEIYIVMHY